MTAGDVESDLSPCRVIAAFSVPTAQFHAHRCKAATLAARTESVRLGQTRHMRDVRGTSSANAWMSTEITRRRKRRIGPKPAVSIGSTGYDYSMTLSARIRSASGIVNPRPFAVLRLITSSNVVGCCTGMSWGRSPRNSRASGNAN